MSERMSIKEFMRGELSGYEVSKMVPHVKSQWLSDLRINPKYSEQGKKRLKARKDHCKTEYCCLGVLSDRIFEQTGKKPERIKFEDHVVFSFDDDANMPPYIVYGRSGLNTKVAQALAVANDEGYSFAEIADWIEENL